jgi:chromosome segregation ATPase
MGSRRDLSVDGSALAVAARAEAESAAAEVPELRRRLERREADIKRKDREIALLQREIQKLSKESKKYMEENENLNRSLSNSRLLNQSMNSVHNQLKQQVAELQQALAASEKSTIMLQGEIEALRCTNNSLEAGLEDTALASQTHQAGRSTAAAELREVQTKVRFLQRTIGEKEEQIQSLEASLAAAKESERRFKGMVEHQQIILAANEKAMSEQAEQLRGMRQSIQVRNETNHILRTQVDHANEFTFSLTKKELEYLRKIEGEYNGVQERNKDLVRSVELHMELLQRAETEVAALRSQLEESKSKTKEMADKISGKYASEQDLATLRFLKKEVVRLRKENKEFQEGLEKANDELRALQFSKGLRSSVNVASVPSSAAARADVSVEQSRQVRIAAEETARALRNRMSFLLEQLEQASLLAASWQQQKAILKAEIGSLLRANHSLREKLISMQRNVLNTLSVRNEGATDKFSSHRAFLTDTSDDKDVAQETSNRLMDDLVALEAASEALIQSGGGQALPDSVEANVERALFDTICAFSAGLRGEDSQQLSKTNSRSKRKVVRSKGSYKLFTAADGRVDIVVEGADVDAGELLMNLQLPSFLKFIQSRPSDKIPKMFTEKVTMS